MTTSPIRPSVPAPLDDPALLHCMLDDMAAGSALYRPTGAAARRMGEDVNRLCTEGLAGCARDSAPEVAGRYAACLRLADLTAFEDVVVLGRGAGALVESFALHHPHLNLYLLDTAPELYMATQRLVARFPGRVRDYRELSTGNASAARAGEILPLGRACIAELAPAGQTLFTGAGGFGELELPVVEDLLAGARRFAAAVHLWCGPAGDAYDGVLWPAGFDDFERCLRGFEPVPGSRAEGDALWRRRD